MGSKENKMNFAIALQGGERSADKGGQSDAFEEELLEALSDGDTALASFEVPASCWPCMHAGQP